jgi:hypothetical protein
LHYTLPEYDISILIRPAAGQLFRATMKIVNFFLWQPQTIVKTKKTPTIMRRFIFRNGGVPFPNRRSTAKLI